jgi:hypothetical protein
LWQRNSRKYYNAKFFLLIENVIGDNTIERIVEDQYHLASMAGISLMESASIPEFEREAFVNLLVKSIKQKQTR